MELPFKLPEQSRVLVAGAGGGFDVYCALPIALKLRELGHQVHLANYSFTNLAGVEGSATEIKRLFRITSESVLKTGDYFPELHLCRWWQETFSEEIAVWCYGNIGVRPLTEIFRNLQSNLNLDAVILIDGGVDGLFIGNEFDLATPSMDAISIIAASLVDNWTKIYGFTAFGTEGAESGVRHSDALLRISELTARGSMYGVTSLADHSNIGPSFVRAVEYVNRRLPADKHSVITGSVVEALKGKFGYTSYNSKTQTSKVWISPLTCLYWFFHLDAVAAEKPYLKEVVESDFVMDVANAIERTRNRLGVLPKGDIPI